MLKIPSVEHSRLARRMTLYVVLASTLVSIFAASFQLYGEYRRDIQRIDMLLKVIEQTHLSNISSRLWVLDLNELSNTIEGIFNLPSLQYIEVSDMTQPLIALGEKRTKNIINKSYSLFHQYHGEQMQIGRLYIEVTLDDAYQHIIDLAVDIFISNGFKTFIVSGLILIIFYQLVARHLIAIGRFAETMTIHTLDNHLELNRITPDPSKLDELDLLCQALLSMQSRLTVTIKDLQAREKDLSTTLNSIGDAIITTDAIGLVTLMNPVAEKLTDWKLDDAIGQPLEIIFPIISNITGEPLECPVDAIVSTGKTIHLSDQATLISLQGSRYQITNSAAPIYNDTDELVGVVLVFSDVTEQYRLRQAAAKSEARVLLLLNSTAEAIYGIDTGGRCIFVNQSCLSLLGYEEDTEVLGKKMHQLIHYKYPDNTPYPVNECLIYRAFKEGEGTHSDNEVLWRKDGSSFSAEYWSYPIYEEEICVGAVVTFLDITNKKLAEATIRHSQKMDALGKLTGGIAHDYNNMLGVVMGYSELLEAALTDQPTLQTYVHEIRQAGERGAQLTKKILSFSRETSPTVTVLDINQLLQGHQLLLEKTLTARVTLIFDLTDDLWPVRLDGGDLGDAIINLSSAGTINKKSYKK